MLSVRFIFQLCDKNSSMGILFSFFASVFFALSHVTIRPGVSKLGVPTGTVIMLATGSVLTTLIAVFYEGIEILLSASLAGVFYLAASGVVHFLGGWGFMNASASRIGPTRVSAMTASTPLFAALIAFITINERINWVISLGIVLIVVGIYTITTSKE